MLTYKYKLTEILNFMQNKQYFTTAELAEILGISRVAVFNKIKNGQIGAEKIGRNYIVWKKNIDKTINAVLTDKLTDKLKGEISMAVAKVIKEYGETLKKLGQE